MRKTVPRREVQDPQKSIQYSASFYEDQWKEMLEHREKSGVPIMAQIRRGVEMFLAGESVEEPEENTIAITLSPDDMAELAKLSDNVLHIDDINLFVKSLTRAAISAGPEAVHKIIYSRLDRARNTRMASEAKSTERKEVATPGQRRKAA